MNFGADVRIAAGLRQQRWAQAIALGGLLVVLGAGLAAMLAIVQPQVSRTLAAGNAAAEQRAAMLDQETGLRGYLLTGQDAFLRPYRQGRAAAAAAEARLAAATQHDRALRSLVRTTSAAADAWQRGYAVPSVADPAVRSDAQVQRGKALFDAYRATADRLRGAVDARAKAAVATQRTALLAGFAFAVLASAGLLVLARRQSRELDAWVTHPILAVADGLVDVHAGRAVPTTSPGGPAELRGLWRDLTALADDLTAERTAREERDIELAAHALRAGELLELTQDFTATLHPDGIRSHLRDSALVLAPAAAARIWDVDEVGAPTAGTDRPGRAVVRAARTRAPVLEADSRGGQLAVPVLAGGRCLAVLELWDLQITPDTDLVGSLATLCSHAATALTSAELHRQVSEASLTDAVTGVANRRRFDADLTEAVDHATRNGRELALLMIDLDHFKALNDTHGHQAGDLFLRRVAELFGAACHPTDGIYRYGGDEFAVLLHDTSLDGAAACARRLRAELAAVLGTGAGLPTLSIGVAALPRTAHDAGSLLGAADAALYQAKSTSRDQVRVAPALPAAVPEPRALSA